MKRNFRILHRSGWLVMFFLLVIAAWAPNANAFQSIYDANCVSCHGASPRTCNGCHHHGPSGLSATTDKTTYSPGAPVKVTFQGGSQSGWIRAILYLNNVEVARSTGPSNMGGGAGFPITFTTTAPPASATPYTYEAAWFGNLYDKNNPTTASHGEVRVSSNSFNVVAADTTSPSVGSTVPVNGATAVPATSSLTATFSEPVDPATVTTTNFLLKQGTTGVPGTVTLSGTTATFKPSASLSAATSYSATITTGVKDLAGNPLAANYSWTFTTAAAADGTPPAVSSVTPLSGATGVAVNASVTATFSEAVDPATVTASSFTLKNGASAVSSAVSVNGTTATLAPNAALASGAIYTAALSTGVKDLAGNALAGAYSWTFTTGSAPDATPPTVTSTSPAANATGIQLSTAATATFSEKMDATSITTATYTLKTGASAPIGGAVTYVGTTATFAPASPLAPNTTYTATLATGVKDLAGNGLAQPYTWSFTTASRTSDRDDDGVSDDDDEYPDDDAIATVREPRGRGKIKIDVSSTQGAYLRSVKAIVDSDPSLNQTRKPAGYEFRYGMVEYEARGIDNGATMQVRITYPEAIPSGSKVYQSDSAGFRELPGATVKENTVTLTLTDGGTGDRDLTRNAVITDPVGVATPVAESAASGGGGCSMTGTGGDPWDAAGAFGTLALAALVFALRGRRKGKVQ